MIQGNYDTGSLSSSRWDDLNVAATQAKKGANDKPDFDYTNIGLLFPQNDATEKIYLTFQMSHKKKLGTPIHLHIHYIQAGVAKPVFRAEVRFYNNGSVVPAFSASINTNDVGGNQGVFPYTSGSILQIAEFPWINAPANEDVSANFDVILYRNDNVVTGDVLVKYIDLHYEIDSDGSREEFVK